MENLNHENIKIFVSEKADGSMNFCGDFFNKEINSNRRKFFQKIGIDSKGVVSANLVHGVNIEVVGNSEKGKFIQETDGLVTNERGVFLTVTVADCLPIFLWTEKNSGVGILHSGWRSIAGGIVEEGVEKLQELTSCPKNEILLKIGPSIKSCCFEVGDDVLENFDKFLGVTEIREDRKYIDLQKVVKKIALKEGLLENNIEIESECTSCLPEKYFSYRRDKPKKVQAMVAGIGIL